MVAEWERDDTPPSTIGSTAAAIRVLCVRRPVVL
jgi:hypothetical protein